MIIAASKAAATSALSLVDSFLVGIVLFNSPSIWVADEEPTASTLQSSITQRTQYSEPVWPSGKALGW